MTRVPDDGRTRLALREATMEDHRRVDDLFATFSLDSAASYVRFLKAHAMALGAIESAARPASPRLPLLKQDIAAMGESLPSALPPADDRDDGYRWGLLYTLEGSRLGGAMLARQVGPDLPKAYLSAAHGKGEWKAFQHRLDKAAGEGDPHWLDNAIAGARAAFALFAQAALAQREPALG